MNIEQRNDHVSKFYSSHNKKLLKDIKARVGIDDCEDVLQESFYKALRSYSSWDPRKGEFGSWIYGIIRRCIKDCLKEQRLRGAVLVESSDDLPENLHPYYDDVEAEVHEQIALVYKLITSKPYPNKDVLYMYHFMGYTVTEISEILEIPYKTVQMCVYRFKGEALSNG